MEAVVGAFIQAIIGVIFFGTVGFLGIIAGKKFRDSKDLKKAKKLEE